MLIQKKRKDGIVQGYYTRNSEGDCYSRAGKLIFEKRFKDAFLCHGMVYHLKSGWHDHAWIEFDNIVYDKTIWPKDAYYRLGKIKNVKRYTIIEAAHKMFVSKHYGPWSKI